jgi:hypothetical protein
MWLFVPLMDTYMDTKSDHDMLGLPKVSDRFRSRFAILASLNSAFYSDLSTESIAPRQWR